MSDKETCALDLQNTVKGCLPKLRRLLLAAEIYGNQENARLLYDVVTDLEDAVPFPAPPENSFLVDGRISVTRRQVADLLAIAFADQPARYTVVEHREPRRFAFRTRRGAGGQSLDYALNEDGSLVIRTSEPNSDTFLLDLASIADGLNQMAATCPRHFSDLVNDNADAITAGVLLECCLFGEAVYS